MSGEGQTGGGIAEALKAGVNYLTGSSNPTATGNSATHQDGVDHIQNKLADRERDPNTISAPDLSSSDTPGTSSKNFPLNTADGTSQSARGHENRPQTLPASELQERERDRGDRGEQTGLPSQVAESYRNAPDVAPQTTGTAEAIHDKREMQQELESIVAQPAPPTSEGVGHGPGAYSDSGVRGGGVGTTNQTGGVAPSEAATALGSVSGQYDQGVEFTGHRSADQVAGHVAGLPAESTGGITAPKAGWHPDNDAATDSGERGTKDLSVPGLSTGRASAAGDSLTERTRNDPAFDKSGHSRSSDLTAGTTGLGASAAGSAISNSTRDDPAHDTSGTFVPQTDLGSIQRGRNDRQTHDSEHRPSASGAGAAGAGLAAGVAGTETSRDREIIDTTQKERTDATDTATEKLRRDPANSASDDAVLGSSPVGRQASRGERGTAGSDLNTTESATDKLRRDPAHSASDDHVLGSDAQGHQSSRGEHVDPERAEEVKHQTPKNSKDDPYWQGKESAREHLEHEAREGRSVKENPASIPTAGGEPLGMKHWGESKKLPE